MGCYWNKCKGTFWQCELKGHDYCDKHRECVEQYTYKGVKCKYYLPIGDVPQIIDENVILKYNEKYLNFINTWFNKYPELKHPNIKNFGHIIKE